MRLHVPKLQRTRAPGPPGVPVLALAGAGPALLATGSRRSVQEALRPLPVPVLRASSSPVPDIQRQAPGDPQGEVAGAQRAVQEAREVAADLVEEVTGRPVMAGRLGARRRGAITRRTREILRELETIANNPAVPAAQRDKAVRLHAEIEDLDNAARKAEINRARASGAPVAERRAEERARALHDAPAEGKAAPAKAGKVEKGVEAEVKGAGAVVKAESTALKEAQAASRLTRVGSGLSKVGSVAFHALLPTPLDAFLLMIEFCGSYAEAQQAIRDRNLRRGFALGLAGLLLGRSHRAIRKQFRRTMILDRDVHTQIVNAVGVAEKSHNLGLEAGLQYAGRLSDEAKDALRDLGFTNLRTQGRLPAEGELFTADSVARLAAALHDAVDQIFEEMRKQEERAREAERRRDLRDSGCIGNKC